MNSNDDISYIELHRYISLLVSQKKMKFDKETEKFLNDTSKKFIGLENFKSMSEDELRKNRVQIEKQFEKQMKEVSDKFTKLNLIKEILEIDLNYYYKQLKNIKNILKNDNFKISMNIINEKISSNQDLTSDELNQVTFYSKLINQKVYIEKVILSDTKVLINNKKDEIKKELFIEMKNIQKETKIFIEENKTEKLDYQKILQNYNDYELQKLLSSLNEMIFEDKNQSLRYKIIDNLHRLTNKSYKEINMILKDNKFKEKLFGNLQIQSVNQKLSEVSDKLNEYKKINDYMKSVKKSVYVCPICNYMHEMAITTILHMTLHKEKNTNPEVFNFNNKSKPIDLKNPIEFNFYNYNGEKYSTYSINPIKSIGDYIYEIKGNMNNIDKNSLLNIIRFNDINKGSFEDMRQPLSLHKIIHKVDYSKTIQNFAEGIKMNFDDKNFSVFNIDKEIKKIINEQVKRMEKVESRSFTKNTRIINFKVFKTIFGKFFDNDDIPNLYNSVIEFYDNNLKTNNDSFDLLFKNIIHYDNRKPIEAIHSLFMKLFKIIRLIKEQKYNELLYILSKKKIADTEAYEYVDTKVLLMLVPLLESLDLLNNIHENLENEDDIKVNDDFHPISWTDKKNYKKLLSKISNITKDSLIINPVSNDRNTDEIRDQFTRLNEIFQNIDMKKLRKMEKQYNLIHDCYIYMIKNNMFLHNIQNVESNKNIQEKYNEYINGTFLLITMNYMDMIVKQNKNNTDNTKMVYNTFFKTLSLYLTEDSKYLKKNKNIVKRRVVKKQQNIVDNRDELLNDYFDSDDEDFNEEIGDEEEIIEEINDEFDDMEDLFGEDYE